MGDSFDLWVYRDDRAQSVFGDLVWLEGSALIPAAEDRLRRAGWSLTSAWRAEGEQLIADVALTEQ